MRLAFLLLLAVLAVSALAFAAPTLAQTPAPAETPEYPWYDLEHRLTVAAAARYQWFASVDGDVTPPTPREFVAGPLFAYELTEHLTATASIMYGFDSKNVVTQVGLSIPLFGKE